MNFYGLSILVVCIIFISLVICSIIDDIKKGRPVKRNDIATDAANQAAQRYVDPLYSELTRIGKTKS